MHRSAQGASFVLVVLGMASAAIAQVPFQVVDGFASQGPWGSVVTTDPGVNTAWLAVGGNPGGNVQTQLRSTPNVTVGAGFQYLNSNLTLGSQNLQVEFQIDARFGSTVPIPAPQPRIVPMLIQGARIYRPSTAMPISLGSAWTTLPLASYDLSTFTTSSGTPLNVNSSVRVGFWTSIEPDPLISVSFAINLDNVLIRVVPSPGAAGLLMLASLATLRRRR